MRSPSRAVLPVLLGGYLAARLYILVRGTVFTSYDTFSYAYRGDPQWDRGPLVSLTGHAPRLFGVPLFYALFPNDQLRAVGQWTVGTVAWAALAWALWTALSTLPARALAAAGVLGLALTHQVASWDFAILAESLSISLGVLSLAFLLAWWRSGSRWYLAGLVGAATWWTFTRPEVRLTIGLLIVVLAGYAWRHRETWRLTVGAGAVLVLAVGWVTLITPNTDRTFAGYSATGLPLEEQGFLYRLRLQVLPDPDLAAVYRDRLGMPDCPGVDRIAAGSQWAIAAFADEYRACPELRAWGERNATSSGYRAALAAPGGYTRIVWGVLPISLAGTAYARAPTPLPAAVERIAFPPRRVVRPSLAIAFLVAAAGAVVAGAWRSRGAIAGAVLAASSAVNLVVPLMYSVGEYARFGIQEAVGLRLAVLMIATAAVDRVLARAGERRAAVRPLAVANA